MAYQPQTWNNGPGGGTPVSAARLAYIEAGIAAVEQLADPLARTVEGVTWFLAGHSYGTVPSYNNTASPGASWITRLAYELDPYSLTNASQNGYWATDVAGRILGTPQPISANSKGLVFIDVGTNDIPGVFASSAKATAGITNSVKAMIAGAQAASKTVETNAIFTYGGSWTTQTDSHYGSGGIRYTTQNGATVSIALPSLASGLNYTLLLTATDGAIVAGSTSVEVKLDGVVQSTISLNNQMHASTQPFLGSNGAGFYPLTVAGNGSPRTLLLTNQTTGTLGVDDLLIPQATPPQVVLLGQVPWVASSYSSNGGATSLALINSAIQAAMTSFDAATLTYIDMSVGWVPATMTSSTDGLHPNDFGHATRTATVVEVLKGLPFRQGMNVL